MTAGWRPPGRRPRQERSTQPHRGRPTLSSASSFSLPSSSSLTKNRDLCPFRRRSCRASIADTAHEAQLRSRMLSLSKASLKIAFGFIGSCTPFQSTWDVSCPCAMVPSLAVKLIVLVKVALPFVSFWLSLPHSVKWPLQSTPASLKLTVPVSVKVAQNSSPPGKKVTCSTALPSTCHTTVSFVHGLNPSGSSKTPCWCVEMLTVCPGPPAPAGGAKASRHAAPASSAAMRIALIIGFLLVCAWTIRVSAEGDALRIEG